MSKSLQLVNGDLNIQNRSLQTIGGVDKLFQDLSLWLEEHAGRDPMTPNYGSILDGGILNNQNVPPFIGQVLNPLVQGQVQAEVNRVVTSYQQSQLQKMKQEAGIYQGKTTLDPDEIISTIDSIQASNLGTTVVVRVQITTIGNTQFTLTLPISNT
jgi:phage baseplate assembly protein W